MKLKTILLLICLWLASASCTSSPPKNTPPTAEPTTAQPATPTENPNLPWSGRNLTGSLIFVRLQPGKVDLQKLNLVTGEQSTLYQVPERGWLSAAAASPDGVQAVLAYAPPPAANEVQFGYSDLYVMPLDGTAPPQLLTQRTYPDEIFFNPVWSPDGRFLYYTHITPPARENDYITNLERLELATGQISIIAAEAIWPRLSADGSQLAYITTDLLTLANTLYLANADGTAVSILVPPDNFLAVDSPLFSPDGAYIYFSGVPLEAASLSWLDKLLGVQTAAAHSLPSDWWRVPVGGGLPELVAPLQAVGLYGAFAPDGRTIAFTTQTGLYVMNPDGSDSLQLLETAPTSGLSWIP